jgi:hypothetical protein
MHMAAAPGLCCVEAMGLLMLVFGAVLACSGAVSIWQKTCWKLLWCGMQVYGAVWNNFLRDKDGEGNEVIPPSMFVTYGVKHMKIWTLGRDTVSGKL